MASGGFPCSFVTIQPTLVIEDLAAAKPILADYVQQSRNEPRLIYCGWSCTRSTKASDVVGSFREGRGDRLCLRQAYPDGDAAAAHMKQVVVPCLEALVDGPVSPGDIEIHGPAAEIQKCGIASVGAGEAKSFVTVAGVSFMEKEAGGVLLPMQLTSVHSTFKVNDWAATQPMLDDFVERTRKNEKNGCIYSAFSRCDDELALREAYGSPSAIAKHVENVSPITESLLGGASSPLTLTRTQLHGSLLNLRSYQESMRREGVYGDEPPEYFYKGSADERGVDGGFSRFELQQSMFGFSF